ncbi:hypothetical protein RDI58_010637 [Solanum bulbocastanum]|uniref:Uncharacterized protein n=1 Tax=Solanum bulbocastanum TaxID=147425 RepID=A0AAN8TWQ0_SOLBU
MYNSFAATEFSWDDVKVHKHREDSEGSIVNAVKANIYDYEARTSSLYSTELANQFKIKREQLANKCNDKAKKEHALIAYKRKNSEDFIPQQEKSILLELQMSSKKGVTASVHVTGETLGNAKEQHDIHDLLNFKEVKRKSVLPAINLDEFLEEQRLQKEHDIQDLPNHK